MASCDLAHGGVDCTLVVFAFLLLLLSLFCLFFVSHTALPPFNRCLRMYWVVFSLELIHSTRRFLRLPPPGTALRSMRHASSMQLVREHILQHTLVCI